MKMKAMDRIAETETVSINAVIEVRTKVFDILNEASYILKRYIELKQKIRKIAASLGSPAIL